MRNIIFLSILITLGGTMAHAQRGTAAFGDSRFYLKGTYGVFRKLAKTDPSVNGSGFESAINDLKTGSFFGAEGGMRVARNQYLGITYSRSNETAPFQFTFNTGFGNQTINGTIGEAINYVGVNYNYLVPMGQSGRSAFSLKSGIGYVSYKASINAPGFIAGESRSANNIGFQLGGGFEFGLAKNIGLFADVDLLGATITIEDEKENLTQVRIGGGLAFRF